MKKVKIAIMTLAILLSIGGAFATRRPFDCRQAPQYYFNGSTYVPAGVYGQDYVCSLSSGNCTFWLVGGVYTLCQVGTYTTGTLQKPATK